MPDTTSLFTEKEAREMTDERLREAMQEVWDTTHIGLMANFEGMLTYHNAIDGEQYASVVEILEKHGFPIIKWEADFRVFRFFLKDVKRIGG